MKSEPLKGKIDAGGIDYLKDSLESGLDWTIQTIEYEIEKAIRDYHKMELPTTTQEIVVEKLLLMYIDTAYGCIQTIQEGLSDVND